MLQLNLADNDLNVDMTPEEALVAGPTAHR